MARYTLAVGTHDPDPILADDDQEAVRQAGALVRRRYADDLSANPQEVATLLGPEGLLTGPTERIDAFVLRAGAVREPAGPGESDTPDCNGA